MSVWSTAGDNRVSNILFKATAVENYYLALYTVPATEPTAAMVSTTFTEPSTANGYARLVLTRGSWTTSGGAAVYAEQTFTCSTADWGNTYGYYIITTSAGTGVVMCAEQFTDAPYYVFDGDSVKVTPTITVS